MTKSRLVIPPEIEASGVFADIRLAAALSSGKATAEEIEELRRQVRNRDPVCWRWPAPKACTFEDEDQARSFLRWWHNGMCAVCGMTGELVEDHDHRTALVRGRLCRSCNGLEAHAEDESSWGKYRRRNPAAILGISVRYWSPWIGEAQPVPELSEEEERAEEDALRASVDRLSMPGPEDLAP